MTNELPAYNLDEILDGMTEDGEGASLAEETVRLCLNGKLRREYEETKARIDERAAVAEAGRLVTQVAKAQRAGAGADEDPDTRLGVRRPDPAGEPEPERDPEQDRLDELVVKMKRFTVPFLVRAMDSAKWNTLVAAHPPRKDAKTGKRDEDDWEGINSTTFYRALVPLSLPDVSDAQWAKLCAVLTDAQMDKLAAAAKSVNRRDDDLPF